MTFVRTAPIASVYLNCKVFTAYLRLHGLQKMDFSTCHIFVPLLWRVLAHFVQFCLFG